MKTIWQEILTKEEDKFTFGHILQKQSSTLCVVEDKKGRQYLVESDGTYTVGQNVVVSKGTIIGVTKGLKTYNEYEV